MTDRPIHRRPSFAAMRRWSAILILTLALAEVAVRVVFSNRRFDDELLFANAPLQRLDPELGWALNSYVTQRIRTVDGEVVEYRTDSHGFRGAEPGREPKMLFAGDSFTFGTDANLTFPSEFSRLSGISVVNAGVPGYGTDQAFLMIRRAIDSLRIRPDIVIYGFYWNDILNNVSGESIHTDPPERIHKPLVDLVTREYQRPDLADNDVTIRIARPSLGSLLLDLVSRSKFLRAIGRVVTYRLLTHPAEVKFGTRDWNYLAANLDNFADYLAHRNIRFVVLHIATGPDVIEDQVGRFLAEYCGNRRIAYIRPVLQAGDLHRMDQHLSDRGARHVAEVLVHALQ